jgi:hypothetical protein
MWIFKYLVCLIQHHEWVGARYKYCLRCGKLAKGLVESPDPLAIRDDSV